MTDVMTVVAVLALAAVAVGFLLGLWIGKDRL